MAAKKSSSKGMMNVTASPSEEDWRARMDCDCLMQAEQVMRDPKRRKAALAEAKRRTEELEAITGDPDD